MKALQKKEWEIVLAQVSDRGIPMPHESPYKAVGKS